MTFVRCCIFSVNGQPANTQHPFCSPLIPHKMRGLSNLCLCPNHSPEIHRNITLAEENGFDFGYTTLVMSHAILQSIIVTLYACHFDKHDELAENGYWHKKIVFPMGVSKLRCLDICADGSPKTRLFFIYLHHFLSMM